MIETSPPDTPNTELTRFNALRHGILSRYTVLPWEDAEEYRAVVAAARSCDRGVPSNPLLPTPMSATASSTEGPARRPPSLRAPLLLFARTDDLTESVLDTLVASAARLCRADRAELCGKLGDGGMR
jgi:hypothetical protein